MLKRTIKTVYGNQKREDRNQGEREAEGTVGTLKHLGHLLPGDQ